MITYNKDNRVQLFSCHRSQIRLVQMIILLHKEQICQSQYRYYHYQIYPMRQHRIRNQIDKYQRYRQLQHHVQHSHLYMTDFQFIGHQLIRMLPVCFPQILMQHDAVYNGEARIYSIHHQQQEVRHILRLHNHTTQNEQQDKRHADRPHIPGKTFRLSFRAEVEEAEHQHAQHRHHDDRRLYKYPLTVEQHQRHQHRQRIPRRDTVDTIHEIIHIRDAHVYDERQHYHPPHAPMQDVQLVESQSSRHKLHHQTQRIRQAMNIVHKADTRYQREPRQEPRIGKAEESRPNPHTDKEDNPSATQHNAAVRTPFVRLINDVTLVRYAEIKKLCHKQQSQDKYISYVLIHN